MIASISSITRLRIHDEISSFSFLCFERLSKSLESDRVALTLGYRRGRRVPPICSQSGTKNNEEALFLYMHYAQIYMLCKLQEFPMARVYAHIECQDVNCTSCFSLLPPLLLLHNFFGTLDDIRKHDDRIFTLGFTLFFQARFIYFFFFLPFSSFLTGKSLYQAPGNRTYFVFHAGHTYPSPGFVLLGLNEILFLPCAAAKAKSREVCACVCVCAVFLNFLNSALSLSPLSVATSVFNFLWIMLSSQLSTSGITYTRVCFRREKEFESHISNVHSRAAVSHHETLI